MLRNIVQQKLLGDFEIGPSLVTEVKDGKTVNWNSWSSKNKQQPTEIAKNAIEENKVIKQSKRTNKKYSYESRL